MPQLPQNGVSDHGVTTRPGSILFSYQSDPLLESMLAQASSPPPDEYHFVNYDASSRLFTDDYITTDNQFPAPLLTASSINRDPLSPGEKTDMPDFPQGRSNPSRPEPQYRKESKPPWLNAGSNNGRHPLSLLSEEPAGHFAPTSRSAWLSQQQSSTETQNKKRHVRSTSIDDGDTDGTRRRRLKMDIREPERPLACPFAKHNPIISPGCWDFAAESLARLKEHLLRRHIQPFCPVCLDPYPSSGALDAHVRENMCQKPTGILDVCVEDLKDLRGKQRGPWMTHEGVEGIRRRTKKGESPTEGWQRIYSIIFPADDTRFSPYVEDIGRLCAKQFRKTAVDEFIIHVYSTLNTLSSEGITNDPSSVRYAFVSHLNKVAAQFIERQGGEDTEPAHGSASTSMIRSTPTVKFDFSQYL